jgi:predicted dehydrogenase
MTEQIGVAVVGCGYWGPNLVRNFIAQPDCRVWTVCDSQQSRLDHLKAIYPFLATTTDPSMVLVDPEIKAVAIATPVGLHFDLARRSLLAGKHVFLEKPMATTSRECLELIHLAEQRSLTLMVGHTFIYSSPVRRIKEIIDAGEIGEVHYISARRLNLGLFQKDINVTWDLAPHDISIILYLLGKAPRALNCQGKAHVNPGIEDITNLTLDFDNGQLATIQSSWLDPNKIREMTIVGSKKMIVYDDNHPLEKIRIYDKRVEMPPHYDDFASFQYSYHYGDLLVPYIKQTEPLKVETAHFLDCIRTGEKPVTSGWEGLQVVQILEKASESIRAKGGSVPLDGREELLQAMARA